MADLLHGPRTIRAGWLMGVDTFLTSGQITCEMAFVMVQEVAALAAAGRFDHVIIEGSGISEPLPVAAAFAVRGPTGGTLSDVATLDTLACPSPDPFHPLQSHLSVLPVGNSTSFHLSLWFVASTALAPRICGHVWAAMGGLSL